MNLFNDTNLIYMLEFYLNYCCIGDKEKNYLLIRNINKQSRKELWNTEKERIIIQMENLKGKISDLENIEQIY